MQAHAEHAPWSGNQSRLRLLPLQRSVAVGPVNDPLEHEAERVAEQVMRTSASQMATPPTTLPGAAARKAPGIVDRALSSPGQLLDGATRGYFEPRFGLNFDAVRVHTDDAAKHSAAAIGARAYTHGSHILFAAGERPGADRLTAHELTHVAQNASGGGPPVIRRAPTLDAYEIISPVWNVSGRDVVIVRMKSDGRTFFFYRRSGLGSKGRFTSQAAPKDAWVPFEGFVETEELRGSSSISTHRFHKEPNYYSPAVREGQVVPGYGTQTNKNIAKWLDEKLPPGAIKGEPARWSDVQNEFAKYNARNLPYPGTEAPLQARTASGETGGGPAAPTGGTTTPAGEVPMPQSGSVIPEGGTPVTTAAGEINVPAPKVPPLEGGFGTAFKSGFMEGLKGAFSPEGIASMIPEVVLAIADRVALRDAIRAIETKFAKEGFAKGFAAGVTGWTEEEVGSNLKHRVTPFRVQGLQDPAGFLTLTVILQLAEAYESYAVDLGFRFSSSKTLKWKSDMLATGFTVLAKYGYHFGDDPQGLFEYGFIDKLGWVLRTTTDPIVDQAIERSDDRREAEARRRRRDTAAVGMKT
jgi:hypothetical protein